MLSGLSQVRIVLPLLFTVLIFIASPRLLASITAIDCALSIACIVLAVKTLLAIQQKFSEVFFLGFSLGFRNRLQYIEKNKAELY